MCQHPSQCSHWTSPWPDLGISRAGRTNQGLDGPIKVLSLGAPSRVSQKACKDGDFIATNGSPQSCCKAQLTLGPRLPPTALKPEPSIKLFSQGLRSSCRRVIGAIFVAFIRFDNTVAVAMRFAKPWEHKIVSKGMEISSI